MKRVLVSGATGFIGGNLTKRLAELGLKVAIVSRPETKPKPSSQVEVIRFSEDVSDFFHQVAAFQPDTAFHLASLYLPTHRPEQIERLIASNLSFATVFLEASVSAGVRSFINTGTAWQRLENSSYRAVNLYAATKQAFEAILAYYQDIGQFRALTLRLGDTYGPGDTRRKVIALLLEHGKTGLSLPMSPGEQQLNFVHISDVVEGFIKAEAILSSSTVLEHDAYALRGSETLSLKELARRVEQVTGFSLNVEFGALPYRKREVFRPETLTPVLPGWRPKMNLGEGIQEMSREMVNP